MAAIQSHYEVESSEGNFIFKITPTKAKAHIGISVFGTLLFAALGAAFGGTEGIFLSLIGFWMYVIGIMILRNKGRQPYSIKLTNQGIESRSGSVLSKQSISHLKVGNKYLKNKYQGQTSGFQPTPMGIVVTPGVAGSVALAATGAVNLMNSTLGAATKAQVSQDIASTYFVEAICRGKHELVADFLTEETAIALMNEITALATQTWVAS